MIDPLLAGFVFLGLFSPGPNVILLAASGARFGFRLTVPHILGVALGVGIIAGVTGFGVGAILQSFPVLTLALKIIAFGWILRMAWLLWHSDPKTPSTHDRPFTFFQAVLFQWVNPKVWAVALAATAYVIDLSPMGQAQQLAMAFCLTNLGVGTFWTATGAMLSLLLKNPVAWRVFMRGMACILILFSVMVFL